VSCTGKGKQWDMTQVSPATAEITSHGQEAKSKYHLTTCLLITRMHIHICLQGIHLRRILRRVRLRRIRLERIQQSLPHLAIPPHLPLQMRRIRREPILPRMHSKPLVRPPLTRQRHIPPPHIPTQVPVIISLPAQRNPQQMQLRVCLPDRRSPRHSPAPP